MFSYCTNLSYVNLENLDFSNVENTESMFEGSISLEEFQSPFYITEIIKKITIFPIKKFNSSFSRTNRNR